MEFDLDRYLCAPSVDKLDFYNFIKFFSVLSLGWKTARGKRKPPQNKASRTQNRKEVSEAKHDFTGDMQAKIWYWLV